eukprot:NODE_244_length_11882_cov_0.560214.p12 type:complete len:120 gc:universal NODE_244_length_11882_cov_0.560214:6359-6718(+)
MNIGTPPNHPNFFLFDILHCCPYIFVLNPLWRAHQPLLKLIAKIYNYDQRIRLPCIQLISQKPDLYIQLGCLLLFYRICKRNNSCQLVPNSLLRFLGNKPWQEYPLYQIQCSCICGVLL